MFFRASVISSWFVVNLLPSHEFFLTHNNHDHFVAVIASSRSEATMSTVNRVQIEESTHA
jgi:hypothetical protein